MKSNQISKCKKIKLIVTDVDGVLTDGGRFYSITGEIIKKFNTRDGMGINILLRNGIKTVILTKESSKIVRKWATEMNVTKSYYGDIKKEEKIQTICKKFHLKLNEIAYIGDDVNDLKLMEKVGFSVTPKDGIEQAKKVADYVCKLNGGEGVFRELADLILSIKFHHKTNWY